MFRPRSILHRTFQIGIILKGLDGMLEAVGGLLLLAVSPATIDRAARSLTQHELSEDPHDFLATHLLRTAHGLTGSAVLFGRLPDSRLLPVCCRKWTNRAERDAAPLWERRTAGRSTCGSWEWS